MCPWLPLSSLRVTSVSHCPSPCSKASAAALFSPFRWPRACSLTFRLWPKSHSQGAWPWLSSLRCLPPSNLPLSLPHLVFSLAFTIILYFFNCVWVFIQRTMQVLAWQGRHGLCPQWSYLPSRRRRRQAGNDDRRMAAMMGEGSGAQGTQERT